MVKLILALILFFTSEVHAITYGAYRTFAQGSARSISMGGAFAAVENDASSIWIIPAMIPLTNSSIDVVLTQGQSFSTEPTPQSNVETTFRSGYSTFSMSYTFDNQASLAIGTGTPFSEGPDNPAFANSALTIAETRILAGFKFTKDFAIAPLLILRSVSEKYYGFKDPSGGTVGNEQATNSADMGISLAWKTTERTIMCLGWEPTRVYSLSNPPTISPVGNGIAPVKIPSITRYGLALKIPEIKTLITTQLDWWTNTNDLSAFIDSQYQGVQTLSKNSSLLVPRLGLQHQFVDRFWVNAWIRTGVYVEQPRVEQHRAREHWTLGVESKIWILDFTFGYDSAPGYANTSASLGISLTDYL